MNKFNQIFLDLEEKIKQQIYKEGSMLPSEHELMSIYDVSRETIRKALNLLLEHGYIQKLQGKGSIVLSKKLLDFPITGLTSYKEIVTAQAISSRTEVVELKSIYPKKAMPHTNLAISNGLLSVKRYRYIDNKLSIIDKDYFNPEIVPKLTSEIAKDSIYAYLETELNLKISYALKEITVEPASQEDLELIGNHPYVVVVRSDVYLEDTTLFQYTESRHSIEKFKFTDFARRRPNN